MRLGLVCRVLGGFAKAGIKLMVILLDIGVYQTVKNIFRGFARQLTSRWQLTLALNIFLSLAWFIATR